MNAIILAAGLGSRLRPLSHDLPKPLINIAESTIIENQISKLRDAGVSEIYIVVGYKYELFEFLKSKYNVHLVFNPLYKTLSNVYSLYLCREQCVDTWILEGDVFINNNFINTEVKESTIYVGRKQYLTGEGIVEFNSEFVITNITPGVSDGVPAPNNLNYYVPCGVSYLNRNVASLLQEQFTNMANCFENFQQYRSWDYLLIENLSRVYCKAQVIDHRDWVEIDTPYDYAYATKLLGGLIK